MIPLDTDRVSKRLEAILENEEGFSSKKMFGGFCIMIHGNMCCGVEKDHLILRIGPELYEEFLKEENVRPFDFTGKPLKGFVYVIPKGIKNDNDLSY